MTKVKNRAKPPPWVRAGALAAPAACQYYCGENNQRDLGHTIKTEVALTRRFSQDWKDVVQEAL